MLVTPALAHGLLREENQKSKVLLCYISNSRIAWAMRDSIGVGEGLLQPTHFNVQGYSDEATWM